MTVTCRTQMSSASVLASGRPRPRNRQPEKGGDERDMGAKWRDEPGRLSKARPGDNVSAPTEHGVRNGCERVRGTSNSIGGRASSRTSRTEGMGAKR